VTIPGDVITELNKIAYEYTKCKDPAEALAEIPPLERKLIELDAEQLDHELHDSYWEEYR
jgi:hypothetical protein